MDSLYGIKNCASANHLNLYEKVIGWTLTRVGVFRRELLANRTFVIDLDTHTCYVAWQVARNRRIGWRGTSEGDLRKKTE